MNWHRPSTEFCCNSRSCSSHCATTIITLPSKLAERDLQPQQYISTILVASVVMRWYRPKKSSKTVKSSSTHRMMMVSCSVLETSVASSTMRQRKGEEWMGSRIFWRMWWPVIISISFWFSGDGYLFVGFSNHLVSRLQVMWVSYLTRRKRDFPKNIIFSSVRPCSAGRHEWWIKPDRAPAYTCWRQEAGWW